MSKKGMTPQTAEQLRVKNGIGEGTKLRRMRVKKGISQNELAAVTRVSKKTLERYEQQPEHINSAKLATLCDLCMALGCQIEDIIESDELLAKYRITK